jgi:2-phosphosulfolactate phosphatase
MKIIKYDFVAGAKRAEGITVIIDVFRAFSVACYCFNKGISKLIPAGEFEDALSYEHQNYAVVRIGERNGKKLPGFDFGNSPTEIDSASLRGRLVVQTTHAGTQGLVNACNASEVLTGALVNAKATAEYIKQKQPATVSLVRMGFEASESTDEDDLCADYLESLLLGTEYDEGGIKDRLRVSPCAERFFDPRIPWNPVSDFEYCTDVNRFNFVLRLVKDNRELPYLERVNVKI